MTRNATSSRRSRATRLYIAQRLWDYALASLFGLGICILLGAV